MYVRCKVKIRVSPVNFVKGRYDSCEGSAMAQPHFELSDATLAYTFLKLSAFIKRWLVFIIHRSHDTTRPNSQVYKSEDVLDE